MSSVGHTMPTCLNVSGVSSGHVVRAVWSLISKSWEDSPETVSILFPITPSLVLACISGFSRCIIPHYLTFCEEELSLLPQIFVHLFMSVCTHELFHFIKLTISHYCPCLLLELSRPPSLTAALSSWCLFPLTCPPCSSGTRHLRLLSCRLPPAWGSAVSPGRPRSSCWGVVVRSQGLEVLLCVSLLPGLSPDRATK